MTKNDVVDAFIRGELDRRGFIRKLTAVGVSSAAAVAYAASLGQGAAAAPSRNGAGFITRAQGAAVTDAVYGPAIPIEELQAAVAATVAAVEEIADALSSLLDQFDAGDFADAGLEESARELLGNILSQIGEQLEALNSFLGQPIGMRLATAFMQTTDSAAGSLIEQLAKVENDLNRSVGMYSALIPSMEEMEGRQLMTQIGLVAARHSALVSHIHILGLEPVPGAFEQPIVPETAE